VVNFPVLLEILAQRSALQTAILVEFNSMEDACRTGHAVDSHGMPDKEMLERAAGIECRLHAFRASQNPPNPSPAADMALNLHVPRKGANGDDALLVLKDPGAARNEETAQWNVRRGGEARWHTVGMQMHPTLLAGASANGRVRGHRSGHKSPLIDLGLFKVHSVHGDVLLPAGPRAKELRQAGVFVRVLIPGFSGHGRSRE